MLKVMIVEDETLIANALATLIEKSGKPFEVYKIAENGREAMCALREGGIDVLFTDVRMPMMDGMELLKCMKEEKIDVPTVILSGYSEFKYVRQALQCQVVDYLLKPISKSSLYSVLDELEKIYEKKSRERLENLLRNRVQEKKQIQPGKCYMAVIILGNWPATPDDILLQGSEPEYHKILEKELILWESRHETAWLIYGGTSVERILIIESDKDDYNGLDMISRYYQNILNFIEIPVTIAMFDQGIDFNSIDVVQRRLKSALYKNSIFGESSIIRLGEEECVPLQQKENSWPGKLRECIVREDGAEFKRILQQYLGYCQTKKITQKRLFQQIQIILEYYFEYYGYSQDAGNIEYVPTCCSYEGLYDELLDVFRLLIDGGGEEGYEKRLAPVIRQYLDLHFAENLTNEHLSKKFGFVPCYLGRIFKKDYGITIGNYILSKRMEEAKKLLAEETLVKSVACKVGYEDPYYFSKVFRKNVGCWPSEYHE